MPVSTDCESDLAVLDTAERARSARFRRAVDRVLFVQAHGLLRRVLSRYAAVAPTEWTFVSGPWGKPALCPLRHPALQDLRFNLSHCAGQAAVVVAWGREVGVDVEPCDALAQPGELAMAVLGPSEQQAWQAIGDDLTSQRHFLMTHWTLKEAVLKALGLGLGQVAPHLLEVRRTRDASSWQAAPCPVHAVPALQDWSHHGFLHSGLHAHTHHWAIACDRLPGEAVSWRLIQHPAPATSAVRRGGGVV